MWSEYQPKGDAKRDEVPAEYRWRLDNLYKSASDWEKARDGAEARLAVIAPCKGTLLKDAPTLARCLDLVMDVRREMGRLQTFADADFSTDQTVSDARARNDRVQALATRFAEAAAFVEPELLSAEPETLLGFVNSTKSLEKYTHYIDDLIRRRPHVLSLAEERVLALTGDLRAAPQFMRSALEADVTFPSVHDEEGREQALTQASFPRFRGSHKREVRVEAVTKFFTTLRARSRSFAASLDMAVKADVLVARARGFPTALAAALDPGAVPASVYEMLVETTARNLPATLHRYVAFRARVLGVDRLHYHDLYNPLFGKVEKKVTYPEAVAMAKTALAPLGAGYGKVLAGGLDPAAGWVDVFPNAGKRGGAYCNSTYREHPVVFLNHMDELNDAFTLVHEFGHALHFHLAHQAQEYVNSESPIFLAEIASTFNEELLMDHLLVKAKDKEERRFLLNRRIENMRTTVFRQVMFAEFDLALHREVEGGGALTAERMAQIYGDLIRKYYGPDFVIGPDDAYEWAYIPHFYYNFYVYQYATGLMSAIALARRVLDGQKGAVEGYLAFLRAGGSDYPIPLLKRAGVDLTRPDAMQATFDLFARTLDEIEKL